jgi:hypothetical protein
LKGVLSKFEPVMRLFLILFVAFSFHGLSAQQKGRTPFEATENIRMKQDDNNARNRPKRKKIRVITKNKGEGILYGNPCMVEETMKMGFEYNVQIPGMPGSMLPWRRRYENFKVHLNLIVTKSPFWKLVLNRRVKDCRLRSGDFVG